MRAGRHSEHGWTKEPKTRKHWGLPRALRWLLTLLLLPLIGYLAAANIALSTSVIRDFIASSEAVSVRYARAWTIIPGRVHVEDFWLRVNDSNVQLLVTADRVDATLDLAGFLERRVHVRSAKAEEVRFRFRPKLDDMKGIERRVFGYPAIQGLLGPPLRAHPAAKHREEDPSRYWKVRLENVEAEVEELWMYEFRYEGPGYVHGGMALAPLRTLALSPTSVRLDGGKFHVAGHSFAKHLRLETHAEAWSVAVGSPGVSAPPYRADIKLATDVLRLDPLGIYVPPLDGHLLDGAGTLRVEGVLEDGALLPGAEFDFESEHVQGLTERFRLHGGLRAEGKVSSEGPDGEITVALQSFGVHLQRRGAPPDAPQGPRAEELDGELVLTGREIFGGSVSLGDVDLKWKRVALDDARWLNDPSGATSFDFSGGALRGAARARLSGLRTLDAEIDLRLEDIALRFPKLTAVSRGRWSGRFRYDLQSEQGSFDESHFAFDEVRLDAQEVDARYTAELSALKLDFIGLPPRQVKGELLITGPSLEPLFPLVIHDGFERLIADLVFASGGTHIPLHFDHTPYGTRFRVAGGKSGAVDLNATIGLVDHASLGVFLLDGPEETVGVLLDEGKTHVNVFASHPWYAEQAEFARNRIQAAEGAVASPTND